MITNTPFQKLNLFDRSDAVGRFRVSNPESLIDTDFEYGLQGTKWETLEMIDGIPGPVYRPSEPQFAGNQQIVSIRGSPNQISNNTGGFARNGTMRVTVAFPPALPFIVGNPITVKFTGGNYTGTDATDGTGVITAVISPTVFEYKANTDGFVGTFNEYVTEKSLIYTGQWASGSRIDLAAPNAITLLPGSISAEIIFTNGFMPFPGTAITIVDPLSVNDIRYPWCGNFTIDGLGLSTGFTSNVGTYVTPYSGYPPTNSTSVTIANVPSLSVFINPTGYLYQRTTDGGVTLIPTTSYTIPNSSNNSSVTTIYNGVPTANFLGNVQPNAQIIRQTRKYFRYQSGKSILFSTGVMFKTVLEPDTFNSSTLNATTSLLSITFNQDHGLCGSMDPRITQTDNVTFKYNKPIPNKIPSRIILEGMRPIWVTTATGGSYVENPWNGTYDVYRVTASNIIQIIKPLNSLDSQAGVSSGMPRVIVTNWYDANTRTGIFDDNNGAYFEYDGINFNVVKRNSVATVTNYTGVTKNSCSITNFARNFYNTVNPGESISIKGSNYKMSYINSTFSFGAFITAKYRGQTLGAQAIISKINEERVSQNNFNLDKLDGTGPSGYVLNLNRMQMVFMDYSWYGAGKIRFGLRGTDGNIIWFHEFINNNNNTEAYYRTGNLPARFEINTNSRTFKALLNRQGQLSDTSTVVNNTGPETFVLSATYADSLYLPLSGRLFFNGEVMNYRKVSIREDLNVVALSATERWVFGGRRYGNYSWPGLNQAGTSDLPPNIFYSFNQNCAPTISHWGVSVLMDGGFTKDKSYLFTAATLSAVSVPQGVEIPLISIRMGPSADYGIPAPFGIRNNINRGQLTLESVGLGAVGNLQAIIRINPVTDVFSQRLSGWTNVGAGSIAQYFDHTVQETDTFSPALKPRYVGGDIAGAFYCDEGVGRFAVTTKDIAAIRELGNSILGGDNIHPDGPDILTVSVRNMATTIGATSALARITWTEAQG